VDRLTRWPALAVLAGALLAGCGAQRVAQATLPPAQPVAQPPAAATVVTASTPAPAPATVPTTAAAATTRPGGPLSDAAVASFARLERRLGGASGLAVSGIGDGQRVQSAGSLHSAIAWSTSKVPIAMAIYDAGLAGAEQASLVAAITASDNAAAERLWAALGGGTRAAQAADEQLRLAGDRRTRMQARRLRAGFTPFGQTRWSLTDQARFTAGMACLDAGAQVLGLMNRIVPGERWGLGAAGVSAQFKGGWGPGSQPGAGGGYLDRQLGVMTIRGRPVAFAVATLPSDGSHATGTRNLTAIARWAVAHVAVGHLPRRPRCEDA
jgi:hypothetical protein